MSSVAVVVIKTVIANGLQPLKNFVCVLPESDLTKFLQDDHRHRLR